VQLVPERWIFESAQHSLLSDISLSVILVLVREEKTQVGYCDLLRLFATRRVAATKMAVSIAWRWSRQTTELAASRPCTGTMIHSRSLNAGTAPDHAVCGLIPSRTSTGVRATRHGILRIKLDTDFYTDLDRDEMNQPFLSGQSLFQKLVYGYINR